MSASEVCAGYRAAVGIPQFDHPGLEVERREVEAGGVEQASRPTERPGQPLPTTYHIIGPHGLMCPALEMSALEQEPGWVPVLESGRAQGLGPVPVPGRVPVLAPRSLADQ